VAVAHRPVTRDEAEALRQDAQHWHFGVLYACRDDPRVVVRHRQLIGWSWNLANPWTIPAMLAVGLALLGPAWFLVQRGAIGAAFTTAALIVVPIVLLAHWNASGPRP
jgi:uncharacterized membrane protein